MNPTMFPPLLTNYNLSLMESIELSQIYLIIIWSSFLSLLWDWSIHLTGYKGEIALIWSSNSSLNHHSPSISGNLNASRKNWNGLWPGTRATTITFLLSRYLAIAQGILIVTLFSLTSSYTACNALRGVSYGFSIVSFMTHLVMSLRMYGLYKQSTRVLLILGTLAVLDLGIQLVADTFLQPVFLSLGVEGASTCFYVPSTRVFALTFLSPAVFHHIILAMTLWASLQHSDSERLIGGSVMRTLRKDQVGYVLSICLFNAVNVIMTFQNNQPAYKLIFYFPSMVLTQIFLGRIVFSLRAFSQTHHVANSSFLPSSSSNNNDTSSSSPPTSPRKSSLPGPLFVHIQNMGGGRRNSRPTIDPTQSSALHPLTVEKEGAGGEKQENYNLSRSWNSASTLNSAREGLMITQSMMTIPSPPSPPTSPHANGSMKHQVV